MTHTNFIHYVRIGKRQVGDNVFCDQKSLVHRLMNKTARRFKIGANDLHAGGLGALFDVSKNPIEIDH